MDGPGRNTPQDGGNRLESWKEIAAYLNRGTRTVQRWEKLEGLPVHRHLHERQGTVYAYQHEIDAWWASRRTTLSAETEEHPRPPAAPHGQALHLWRTAGALAAVLLAITGGAHSAGNGWSPSAHLIPGRSVPLTSAPGIEFAPAFSPDGRYVAYAAEPDGKSGADIYVQPLSRGEPRRLTTGGAHHVAPVWSPDSQSIAYLRVTDEKSPPEIVVRPALGGEERRIATWPCDRVPLPVLQWSKDPRWILLAAAQKPGIPTSIHKLNVPSGELQPLSARCNDCSGDSSLALSSDGRTLAFLRNRKTGTRDIYLLQLDGNLRAAGPPRRLTYEDGLLTAPVWMPGDEEVAYAIMVDFSWTWRCVSRRTGASRRLEAFDQLRPNIVFSPDGKYVAHSHSQADLDIHRVDLETGEESPAIVSTRIDANPHLSPNGAEVVFASDRRGQIDIWKSAPDGSNAVQLASFPGKSSGTPRWSPDGSQIAFDVTGNSNADLYVMAADGARIRRLTSEPSRDFIPSWSRDGRFLYFGSDRSGDFQIWRMPAAGGPATQITRNGGYAAWESLDSRSLLYTKFDGKDEGARGLWRMDLATGAEKRLIDDSINWSRTAVTADAIYYISWRRENENWLYRFDLAARRSEPLLKLQRASGIGFTIAPGARWFLYTSTERRGSGLMLAELHR